MRLYDGAEVETANNDETHNEHDRVDTIPVNSHIRKSKTGRKALPEILSRHDVIHELEEAQRVCDHDGNNLTETGEMISEQLDIIPAKIRVLRHIRKKYACSCGQCIKIAPFPNQPIPKSVISRGY